MSDVDKLTEYLLEQMDSELEESKRTSRSIISRGTKIKRATGQLASIEARKRNDPVYQRMVKYRELYFKYREMLHKKYAPRVRSKARQ